KVKRGGVENGVFTGFLREGQLRWLYENCAAYVVPSLSEGFGLPGLEAMAHGAPVVSSNATCLPEIYGEAAQYFDPLSVEAITEAINEVLTRQDVRAALTSAGKERVKKFSWQRMAEQTLEVYDQALQTPPQGDGPLPRRRQLPHRGLGHDRSADHPPDQQPSL